MRKKITTFVVWLMAVAIILSLFHQIEHKDSLSFNWVEKGDSLEINDYTDPGDFSYRLIKKLTGTTFFSQAALVEKSLHSPKAKKDSVNPHTNKLPLYLLFNAFLFYDIT